jgi:hypothetical protein
MHFRFLSIVVPNIFFQLWYMVPDFIFVFRERSLRKLLIWIHLKCSSCCFRVWGTHNFSKSWGLNPASFQFNALRFWHLLYVFFTYVEFDCTLTFTWTIKHFYITLHKGLFGYFLCDFITFTYAKSFQSRQVKKTQLSHL